MTRVFEGLAVGLVAAALLATPSAAQDGGGPGDFQVPPEIVRAGDANAGEGRLYPSPVMHDVDGDGLKDLVIGDLRGLLTVARRIPGEGPPRFASEQPLKSLDGKDLKFHNW